MYEVTIDRAAAKELEGFPPRDQKALLAALTELQDPMSASLKPHTKALQGFRHLYRLRVGGIRIVYVISHGTKKVRVVMFDTRNDMYDKATKDRLRVLDKAARLQDLASMLEAIAGSIH